VASTRAFASPPGPDSSGRYARSHVPEDSAVIAGAWDAAGIVDDWWGRAKVLAALAAGLGGALVFVWYFALDRVGGGGVALLAFALFCCVTGVGTLLAVRLKEPDRGRPSPEPGGRTGLSDAEIGGLEKRYWANKAEEKHEELSGLLASGLDLRAQIEKLQSDPFPAITRATFAVSPLPQKILTWLKEAQLHIRKGGVSADFTIVRLHRTPSAALGAVDATLHALGALTDDNG
jgi:hypothetical protein